MSKCILVVEDQVDNRQIQRDLLGNAGYELTEAENGEEAIAASLLQGRANNSLPIVYVSAAYDGSHVLSPDDLAKHISGTAHVLVEPSRAFSLGLKNLVDSRNAFGGAIGVYWPGSPARKTYLLGRDGKDVEELRLEVLRDVRIVFHHCLATFP